MENLFAFTAVDANYSEGTAGAIYGERAGTAATLTAVKNKIANPNEYLTFLYLFAIERRLFSTLDKLFPIFSSIFILILNF